MEDRKQGGLTGATGSLTPSAAETEEEFVPAETRDINDPRSARRQTERSTPTGDEEPPTGSGSILGGDELRDPEEEHL